MHLKFEEIGQKQNLPRYFDIILHLVLGFAQDLHAYVKSCRQSCQCLRDAVHCTVDCSGDCSWNRTGMHGITAALHLQKVLSISIEWNFGQSKAKLCPNYLIKCQCCPIPWKLMRLPIGMHFSTQQTIKLQPLDRNKACTCKIGPGCSPLCRL